MSKSLEIGCGDKDHWREGFDERMDLIDFGQEIVGALEDGIPREDNTYDEVYASHILEHLDPKKLIYVVNEVHRILRPEGIFWAVVPHKDNSSAYIPSHLIRFTEDSFTFFTGKLNPDYNDLAMLHGGVGSAVKIWETTELVTNNRLHIHWKAVPKGK